MASISLESSASSSRLSPSSSHSAFSRAPGGREREDFVVAKTIGFGLKISPDIVVVKGGTPPVRLSRAAEPVMCHVRSSYDLDLDLA